MTHVALRHSKRLQPYSTYESNLGSELAHLLSIFLLILYNIYIIIRESFVNPHLVNFRRYKEVKSPVIEAESECDDNGPASLVVARGIGLMAAYTGRRAMFAIYPASGEGLEVSSQGPAPICFDYMKKNNLYMVGYVPPKAGHYKILVSRFGKKAVGSPFLLRVDDPPPGYAGHFGAALWHERPPPPPLLSGIVDFVTEKMFLTEDGRLIKLNKGGPGMEQVMIKKPQQIAKSQTAQSQKTTETIATQSKLENDFSKINFKEPKMPLKDIPLDDLENTNENLMKPGMPLKGMQLPRLPNADDYKKSIPVKKQVVSRIENLLAAINRDSKRDPQDKYKYVSKALMKELSLSLKLLHMLGAAEGLETPEHSPNFDKNEESQIPDVKVVENRANASGASTRNQSNVDRFLSKPRESRYAAQRPGKLAWYWGDDVDVDQACDVGRQMETEFRAAGRREGLIGSILNGGRNSRPWRKYGVSGLFDLKKNDDLTGLRLLHNIYRPSDSIDGIGEQKSYYKYARRNLNTNNSTKLEYQRVAEVRRERNNLECDKINSSPKNYCQKDVMFKRPDSIKETSHIQSKPIKLKGRESNTIGSFRTLSLPDVNRIFSLSVQGLRKAKSCSERSFKAVSSNSFSAALKGLLDRDQIYNITKTNIENTENSKRSNQNTVLETLTHYGSDYNKRKVQSGKKSVDEWKRYWEEKQIQNDQSEFCRGCSLEITGIVDRGKAVFESNSAVNIPQIKIFDESKEIKYINKHKEALGIHKSACDVQEKLKGLNQSPEKNEMFSRSPMSNKTAFQKAKDLFEGSYNPTELEYQKDNRRKSISERFYVSSLSKDLHAGVTPELLGVPNRVPAVASLGSIYHPHYPHPPLAPITNYKEQMVDYLTPSWDIMFHSDPNYV